MIALLVIATFFAAILIDHLILRRPVPVAEGTGPAPRPRPLPTIVGGFALRDNYRYHPGHTWAVAETPNLVRVGIDDFAAKARSRAAASSSQRRAVLPPSRLRKLVFVSGAFTVSSQPSP